jgi:2',3'-cyclic-nucleotide 2'-phosphodiesterase (5'-nucleotidase family)
MRKQLYIIAVIGVLATLTGCKTKHYAINNIAPNSSRINTQDTAYRPDSSILRLIAPYKARLDSQMNTVIGSSAVALNNTRPNGILGNFIADILKTETARIIKTDIDFAFTNISGMRIPALPQGDITKGRVFELLPFDNMVMAAEIKGETLKKVLEQIASKGGEAIAGFKLVIKDGKLVDAYINNVSVDFGRSYVVCTNDFLFNGGDGYTMFTEGIIKEYKIGIPIRNMVMDYIEAYCKTNGPINQQPDERITIQ